MNTRKIFVLALVLACLLAAILYVEKHGREKRAGEGMLLDIAAATIERIELRNANGIFAFSRGDASWSMEKPLAARADKVIIEGILDNFCPLKYDRLIAGKDAALEDFGLDRPAIELRLFAKGRPAATVLLGMKNAIDDSSYARLAGDARVAAIASYKRNDLEKDLFAFRDKKFFAIDPMAVTALEFIYDGRTVSLARKDGRWLLEKPVFSLAREDKVGELLSAVSLLEATAFHPAGGDTGRAAFGLDRPLLTADFVSPSGRRRIEIGRKGEATFALADSAGEVCAIGGDFPGKFAGAADSWRERKVARFLAYDVRELSFRQGAFRFSARRDGAGRWEFSPAFPGKKPDEEKVNALLTALAELEAVSFVDAPGALPAASTRIVLKTEDPIEPGKPGEAALELGTAGGGEVIARDPSLPYAFLVGREILGKLPGKIEDIATASFAPAAGK